MTKSSKSPEYVAWISLGLTLVFFALTYLVGDWSRYPVVQSVSWQILAGALIWFVLALQFRLRSLAEREKLDMAHLTDRDAGSTLFHAGGERAELMALAQRRLDMFEKWFLPTFAILTAIYEAGIGWYLFAVMHADPDGAPRKPLIVAVVLTAVAFVSFLISRYATGMSSEPHWKPLRAGGSAMLASAFLCFSLAVGLAFAAFQTVVIVTVLVWVVPILLVVLAAETLLNVLLDLYRPRVKGQYSRAAFDSRILGLVNEPGGLFHSAASAIDYQFGFKVSQTWFYRLLEKAIVPLLLFSVLTLYLFSCIVTVGTGQQAIIERLGRPLETADHQPRIFGPGLILKWPWPIDKLYTYPVDKVNELHIGYKPKIDKDTGDPERGPLLWGSSHYEEEYSVLVASEPQGSDSAAGALPVSMIKANIPVNYRIKDLYKFVYNHSDPVAVLESICYQELAKFAASAKIEVDAPEGAPHQESLLGAGRERAARLLRERIQAAADREGLGIDVVFLGMQGIHPPEQVAADYQAVIGAVQSKQAQILNAQTERNKNLSNLAGSVKKAYSLYKLAAQYQQAKEQGTATEAMAQEVDQAFSDAEGDIYQTLRKAQAYAFEKAALARATGLRFAGQVKAYQAAKDIYMREQRLNALSDALSNVRKYAIVSDPNEDQVVIVDLQEELMPDLYTDILGSQENTEQ